MEIFQTAAIVLAVYMFIMFVIALLREDNSIADIAYGPAFIVLSAYAYFVQETMPSLRSTFAMVAVTLWGLRLAYRIWKKNRGKAEDFRYRKWRLDWMKKGGGYFIARTFFQVFVLQGVIIFLVALPVLLAHTIQTASLEWYHLLGMAIWIFGFLYEAIADMQLDAFLKKKNKDTTIMSTGLWKYSRHPNYFGESMQWWGLALVVFLAVGHSVLAFISPILITYLLTSVSGIPLLEKRFEGNKEWEAYKKKTPAIIPGF